MHNTKLKWSTGKRQPALTLAETAINF